VCQHVAATSNFFFFWKTSLIELLQKKPSTETWREIHSGLPDEAKLAVAVEGVSVSMWQQPAIFFLEN
jgi:hypothetical protein